MKKIILLLLCLPLLSSCAGMSFFPEYRFDKEATQWLAIRNATTNVGLIKGYYTYDQVGEMLYYMDKLIGISSRFDEEYYAKVYNEIFSEGMAEENDAEFRAACEAFLTLPFRGYPSYLAFFTRKYADEYHQAARFLAQARQQDAMHLAMFTQNMNAMANSVDPMKYNNISIPGVNFAPQTPPMVLPKNLLVNTSSGLTQCRVSTSGVVFCF